MRTTVFALALALSPATLHAQSNTELAQQYAALPAVQEMMASMISPEATAGQLAATLPPGVNLNDDQMSRLAALLSEELVDFQPTLEALMINAMADTFTVDELQAQIEWASSDVGSAVIAQTQPLMARITNEMAPDLLARIGSRQGEIMQIFTNP